MTSALTLLFRDTLRRDRLRLGCALFGILSAAALLTWSVGLSVTTWNQCRGLSQTIGQPYDCWVATGRAGAVAKKANGYQKLVPGSPFKMIPRAVEAAVRACDDVASLNATTSFYCGIDWRPEGRVLQGPGVSAGIAPVRNFPECPYPEGLAIGRWPDPNAKEPEFCISPYSFGDDGLKDCPPLGTKVPVITPDGRMMASICGYLSEKTHTAKGFPSMFASNNLADAAALAEVDGTSNLMLIKLKPGRNTDNLQRIVRETSPDDDSATLVTRRAVLHQLRTDAIENLAFQVPLLVSLAIVATVCMIVNALCVGIEQNRRRHARLRALGMTVRQLTGLVLREGMMLAAVGGLVGYIIGASVLWAFVASHPYAFPDGVFFGAETPVTVALLMAGSLGLGLLTPLRRIKTLAPCELRTESVTSTAKHPLRTLVLCLLLLIPVTLTVIPCSWVPAWARTVWFLLIGLPCAGFGLIRMAVPLLWIGEKLLSRPLAALMGLNARLLRGAVTRHRERNARMVLTLTTGLGAFFAIHIWGSSLTGLFIPTRELPQAIVSAMPNGLSNRAVETFRQVPEVKLTPFSAEQYRLHDADFAAILKRTGRKPFQNNIILWATEGDKGVTITEGFARETGLGIGDTFRIQRREKFGEVHDLPLTITAIRRCNWHLVTSRSRVRGRNGAPSQTLGPVFVGLDVAKAWDPERNERTRFFALDGLPKAVSETELFSASDLLENKLQLLASKDPEPYMSKPYVFADKNRRKSVRDAERLKQKPKAAPPPSVIVHIRDEISDGTIAHSSELLGELARIPLFSLLILATGFVSLLAANVRAMAGELRTMHAVGMTRFQMGRWLFAQSLVLCFAGALLALALGISIGWGFSGTTLANMSFGGMVSSLEIPWPLIGEGLLVLLAAVLLVTPVPITLMVRQLLRR